MPFIKVLKNKAYFKRFQVKFRRRRSGQTDYRQRHKLITQDKNKYQSPKYRLVVRFSNRFVLVQVVYAEISGDKVMCAASSQELPKYGLNTGLKNFSAAYCTGLLCARRLLKTLNLEEVYTGVEEPTGETKSWRANGEEIPAGTRVNSKVFFVEGQEEADKKPFRCLLDVGTKNTTTGSRVFAAMKGASDGGLDIPHNNKRFPGYVRDTKTFEAEVLKDHIMGEHVAEYMREMEEDDEENFKKHFKNYIDGEIEADDIEKLYEDVHAAIRENPERTKGFTRIGDTEKFEGFTYVKKASDRRNTRKKTYAERKQDSNAKKAAFANDGDDEEEDLMEA